jgi:dihydroneopterin aldolase
MQGQRSPQEAPERGFRSQLEWSSLPQSAATSAKVEGFNRMSQAEKVAALPGTAAARTIKVFVRDLILAARIGVYQHEKLGSQRVRINLELLCAEHPAINDDLGNVVNYAELVAQVRAIVDAGHINLVETLADRIAQMCLDDRRVQTAKVRIEKLEVFKEAESVGVEIERSRISR